MNFIKNLFSSKPALNPVEIAATFSSMMHDAITTPASRVDSVDETDLELDNEHRAAKLKDQFGSYHTEMVLREEQVVLNRVVTDPQLVSVMAVDQEWAKRVGNTAARNYLLPAGEPIDMTLRGFHLIDHPAGTLLVHISKQGCYGVVRTPQAYHRAELSADRKSFEVMETLTEQKVGRFINGRYDLLIP